MKKIGTWGNLSSKAKGRFRTAIYAVICVMIYVWTAVVGAQTWVECLILYENKSSVLNDIENFAAVEVSEIYANGDFKLEGYSEVHTENEIKGYARVPVGIKPHYHLESGYLITPITFQESEQICIKYVLLDIICYIMLVFLLYDAMKSTKKWKKIVTWALFSVSILIAQCALDLLFGVLFGIGAEMDWVLIIKILIPIAIFVIRRQILKRHPNGLKGRKGKKSIKDTKKALKK